VVKAAREAKTHSSWSDPQTEYERSAQSLVDIALTDVEMRSKIEGFGAVLRFYGSLNSLSQTLLKITCPGVPDFYQGSELWDLSMVDPDNRRPVDYDLRASLLAGLTPREGHTPEHITSRLVAEWPSPSAKLYMTNRALGVRNILATTFANGDYVPLHVSSEMAHACAFARVHEARSVIVLVPVRNTVQDPPMLPHGETAWGNARLELPAALRGKVYTDALSGLEHTPTDGGFLVSRLTEGFPVCLLVAIS
jgi:(1->4)-alpha-D-glucan 1-alpha-D-glucosylmutase